jgi:hypothetical protein
MKNLKKMCKIRATASSF